ncbi:MAG: TIGR02757 family protein [Bacteroidales bacterium]|nr:TIGR02757 family protein [Bacteroidales bacterium]
MIPKATRQMLRDYADRYETASFINGDPSWFMHQVAGAENQEAMAFLASCLSYGNRQQFMPKIQWLLDRSRGDVHQWIAGMEFAVSLPAGDNSCFYRLYTVDTMHQFLLTYSCLLNQYGTLGRYVSARASTGPEAIDAISGYFARSGISLVVPKDTHSACKRLCMFLRWMVRDGSPVDLGLWAEFIDRRTLIMPLDTHVLSLSRSLGLLSCSAASMAAALRLTAALARIFPDDPLRGDFALFGRSINYP